MTLSHEFRFNKRVSFEQTAFAFLANNPLKMNYTTQHFSRPFSDVGSDADIVRNVMHFTVTLLRDTYMELQFGHVRPEIRLPGYSGRLGEGQRPRSVTFSTVYRSPSAAVAE